MVTPEISWIAILPELLLALGAAGVLLIEVQWKPRTLVLGAVAAVSLVLAAGFSVIQWIQAGDAVGAGDASELIVFSGLVVVFVGARIQAMTRAKERAGVSQMSVDDILAVCLAAVEIGDDAPAPEHDDAVDQIEPGRLGLQEHLRGGQAQRRVNVYLASALGDRAHHDGSMRNRFVTRHSGRA